MIANAEGLPESVYRRRLELGDICYCLKTDGKLACYNWISLTRCATYCGFEQEITFRTLSDLQVFTYDFTPTRRTGIAGMACWSRSTC